MALETLTEPNRPQRQLAPQAFDLVAYYEPRADFSVSAGVRRALDTLARRYRRPTLMTGRHSGTPALQTDIKGISVGTRIEVSRLIFRPQVQQRVLAEVFKLFVEAAEQGVASGPIQRITLHFKKGHKRAEPRAAALAAFREVFDCECCFLTPRTHHLELGRAVNHQSLLEHLWETGIYHSSHQPRVEFVANELQSQPGRYENHRFFVRPVARAGKMPQVCFCYSGPEPDNLVEVAMQQKTEEHLLFVSPQQIEQHGETYVSLKDYERAARRFGTLWVMQNDLIRALDRQRASLLFLFFNDDQSICDQWFTWQQLFDRQQSCPHINRASRNSPSFLEMSLLHLREADFVIKDKDRYRIHPNIEQYRHATFYEMGAYHKRFN